jgi:hypothetical protein
VSEPLDAAREAVRRSDRAQGGRSAELVAIRDALRALIQWCEHHEYPAVEVEKPVHPDNDDYMRCRAALIAIVDSWSNPPPASRQADRYQWCIGVAKDALEPSARAFQLEPAVKFLERRVKELTAENVRLRERVPAERLADSYEEAYIRMSKQPDGA